MKRKIIQIDEEKCNGCGLCIPNCHEGALQIIDGKARLISDLFCDGLGACIGHCPEGAIEIVEREAEAYSETKVMHQIVGKGRNTILAHLEHLRDHKEFDLLKEAVDYIKTNQIDLRPGSLIAETVATTSAFPSLQDAIQSKKSESVCGCAGSAPKDFRIDMEKVNASVEETTAMPMASELRQWPVQMHLLNPQASYFKNADVLLAADCVAFALGDFHNSYLKGKTLAIACPKLDSNKESYVEKLTSMIMLANINTLTVMMMEVPCCGGLLALTQMAIQQSNRKIPVKKIIVSIKGEVLHEEWV
ncbi:MAG: 4Fe-4S binding protein [Bacteroidetes bacterium]|nr:4Fe-4S binding protein [Bacteroidota bacterium]